MEVTIAILPIKYLSKDESIEFLVAGLSDDLVISLSKFSGLTVVSPASTAHIKDIHDDDTIAQLGIDYLISGSFRSAAQQARIGIQLTRAGDSKIIFTSAYIEELDQLLSVQIDIVKQIVNAIQQQIDFDLLSMSHQKEAVQLAAYENYLLGMDTLRKGGAEHDRKARAYFEAALKIDPNYARAYTGLSQSYFNTWSCQLWDRWDVSRNGAQKYALKALQIDEQDYKALALAGRTLLFSAEYDKALHYLEKSVRINPNDADNLVQVTFSLVFLGRAEEAEKLYLRACELNPFHPDWYFAYGAHIYFELGNYPKVIELNKKLDYAALWTDAPAFTAAAYYYVGDYKKMEEHWRLYLAQYAANISKTETADEAEALAWQIDVNPYKYTSNIQPFWDYLAKRTGSSILTQQAESAKGYAACLFKEGMWHLSFKGETIRLKDYKGMQDIRKLVEQRGREVHCTELAIAALSRESGIEILDQQAKSDYEKRIRAIQAEIEDCEAMGQMGKLEALHTEYDQLIDQLAGAVGLKGKTRKSTTAVDKARSAVTLRIKSTIKKIEQLHPALAQHLSASIQTGTFCTYRPEISIDWEL